MNKVRKIKIILIIIMFLLMININRVNATDELPDDAAKISSAIVTQTKTGTGPFDDNNDPGNDSSEDNDVVRSFDQVTWTIENTLSINGEGADSYTGGKIYFEATLPSVFTSETVKWDLDSMAWIEDAKVSNDGLTLTGFYQMGVDNITIPGKQTLVFVASILGAKNGIEFSPTIKLWLNGNSEDEIQTVVPDKTTISAAPKYNVKISQNSNMKTKVTVDYGLGDTQGRMYGFGILLQLYNDNSDKGLKGIEYPEGDITFDIGLKLERTLFGSTQREDITSLCTPVLWNYKVNKVTNDGNIPGRTMYFGNSYNRYSNNMPLGILHSERRYSVYNSGNIEIVQTGSKLKVTISDYKFDGTFPIWNYGYGALGTSIIYKDNIGCFSVGYFQVFVPDNAESTIGDRNYYLTLNDNNFSATSISGVTTNAQMLQSDDAVTLQHVIYNPGTYSHTLTLNKINGSVLGTLANNRGDGYASLGQELDIMVKFGMGVTNDFDLYSATKFIKFDGNAVEPIYYSNGNRYRKSAFNGDMEFKVYYVTKPDGKNWIDYTEMKNANVEDMNVYDNISDIPDGYICIGVFLESTTGALSRTTGDNNCVYVPVKVKDTAQIGQTYPFIQRSKYYKDYLDRSIYNIHNKEAVYPTATWDSGNQDYIKTEYDENGKIISGTHSGGTARGNTLLIIAADLSVQKEAIDENGDTKVNYDISKNEYDVTYKITPILNKPSSVSAVIKDVTVTVKDTLPANITYVPNSCNYGEPQITRNDDGSTLLVWEITGCEVGKDIEPIIYKAHIDESCLNGIQITNSVVVFADPDKVGNISEELRTATNTINIINLSSHRLYKNTDTPVIEKNGEIHYTILYKNNTEGYIPNFQLLDILPYNGDSRGSNYSGDYTLDRLVITQQDRDGKVISNDNLEILYTNDESVRNTASVSDSNLGDGWNSANSDTIKQKASAFVVKGMIEPQGSVTIDIYLKTNENDGLDKYVNNATAQVLADTDAMVTSNVVSQVVKRSIEGIAWEDTNRNGLKDVDEKILSNVEMTLTNDQAEQVTDVNGEIVSSVRTDENGYYKFDNLPKDEYYVHTTTPDEKYELTQKEVGINSQINSKFNLENNNTDKIEELNSLDLPQLTVSHVNAGFVQIQGSIEITKVDRKDNSKVIEGATFKLEKLTDEGTIDNSFEALELTTGDDGKVKFEALEIGKYKVTEIKAPEGYELLKESIEVQVTGSNRDIKLVAENSLKLELPITGNINYTAGYIAVGTLVMILALVINKKYKIISFGKK